MAKYGKLLSHDSNFDHLKKYKRALNLKASNMYALPILTYVLSLKQTALPESTGDPVQNGEV